MNGNCRIFVGSLPWAATDDTLVELFKAHGTVKSAKVLLDRETGRSRGFGFVEMATTQEAEAAIKALDGSSYEGRALKVNAAKPRE